MVWDINLEPKCARTPIYYTTQGRALCGCPQPLRKSSEMPMSVLLKFL